ncbi:MAG TPA: FAD-binding oxidoreductase [Candidatus Hydrogenedentes bacterium]|nr:FAD-binding oxidoreductase [Candidatus Hydrogenedentota bacterium]
MSNVTASARESMVHVNDMHSKLNPCWVSAISRPRSLLDLQFLVSHARSAKQSISIAGARHAMGGQQFGERTLHCDMTGLDTVRRLDCDRGLVEVEAGITWPKLVAELHRLQGDHDAPWTIAQKQTGADRLTIGGAVAANIHGRGLRMKPFVDDIEALSIVDSDGQVKRCSRTQHRELFACVVGGYGLFGIVYSVTLRLVRRSKMERIVEITTIDHVADKLASRAEEGFTFGDFQYMTDERSDDYLRKGVLSCYRKVSPDKPLCEGRRELSPSDWRLLTHLSHSDKGKAYAMYSSHYQSTSGQIYWSDSLQMSTYLDNYHQWLDQETGCRTPGSEMITELYVPRQKLEQFMANCRDDFRRQGVNVIYGTVRLIEQEHETLLAWAREDWACIIFNLHVDHTPTGILHAADAFRCLIDRALELGGTYYLTYHRFATHAQVLRAYPAIPEFFRAKRACDPDEVFSSDWYRHYRNIGE